MTVTTAVVLAAGSSRRLGRPKQTLPLGDGTVLSATLDAVRRAPVDQRIVTLGGARAEVRASVDLAGFEVVEVDQHGDGCAGSIVAAVDRIDPLADGFVLLLGDQPAIDVNQIAATVAYAREQDEAADAVVTQYDDGLGHPMWLARSRFPDLRTLRGDKAVWKLLESRDVDVHHRRVAGRSVPLDVDTWDDYLALCHALDVAPAPPAGN